MQFIDENALEEIVVWKTSEVLPKWRTTCVENIDDDESKMQDFDASLSHKLYQVLKL